MTEKAVEEMDLVTLKRIAAEQVDLYSYMPPMGGDIPVSAEPFLVDDSVPTEEEIDCLVTRLRNHRSRGPSGMRAEHLKWWLAETRKKEREEAATEQETLTEGATVGPDGTGKEGTEDSRENTRVEAPNW